MHGRAYSNKYDIVRQILVAGDKTLELEELLPKLLPVELSQAQQEEEESAFYAGKGRGPKPYSSSNNRFGKQELECWLCGGRGHMKRDCPKHKDKKTEKSFFAVAL